MDITAFQYSIRLPGASYLIGLLTWIIIGVRFGTLGFHPFSLWGYYTQMDDEIFELFAAYSFFSFSFLDLAHWLKENREENKGNHTLDT